MNTVGIALRLWIWAALIRLSKGFVPLARLVQLAHRSPVEGTHAPTLEHDLERYLTSKGRCPFRPPSNCLERSLGAYRLLCGVGADPALVIGVNHSPLAGVKGHVWVTAGGRALAERADDLSVFTTIARFDAEGRQLAGGAALREGLGYVKGYATLRQEQARE
ncbi:MAG: lasso peptide biosynthesis B2 protein [Vicinamibacterales bacterium]